MQDERRIKSDEETWLKRKEAITVSMLFLDNWNLYAGGGFNMSIFHWLPWILVCKALVDRSVCRNTGSEHLFDIHCNQPRHSSREVDQYSEYANLYWTILSIRFPDFFFTFWNSFYEFSNSMKQHPSVQFDALFNKSGSRTSRCLPSGYFAHKKNKKYAIIKHYCW